MRGAASRSADHATATLVLLKTLWPCLAAGSTTATWCLFRAHVTWCLFQATSLHLYNKRTFPRCCPSHSCSSPFVYFPSVYSPFVYSPFVYFPSCSSCPNPRQPCLRFSTHTLGNPATFARHHIPPAVPCPADAQRNSTTLQRGPPPQGLSQLDHASRVASSPSSSPRSLREAPRVK